jgi:hypothetical protein
MKSLTETISWDSPVSAPVDSDPFGPGLFEIPLQTLTNRTVYLSSEAASLAAVVVGGTGPSTEIASIDTRISTEESTRASVDTAEAGTRSSEVASIDTAYSSADASVAATCSTASASLTTRVSTEESTRASADASLYAALSTDGSSEVASVVTAIDTVDSALSSETASIESSLSTVNANYSSADASIVTANSTSLSTVNANYSSADASIVTANSTSLSTVTADYQSADASIVAAMPAAGESRWTEIDSADFTSTPAATNEITISNTALRGTLNAGTPIRWLTTPNVGARGIKGTAGLISAENITGVTMAHLKEGGALVCVVQADGGNMFTFKLYDSLALDNLIAHTSSFDHSSSSARTLTADNGSGIGGSITNAAGALSADTLAIVCAWAGIVDSLDESGGNLDMIIKGRPLVTGGATIAGLWYGRPEMVHKHRQYVGGYQLGVVSDTIIVSISSEPAIVFDGPPAQLVHFRTHFENVSDDTGYFNAIADGRYLSSNAGENGLNVTSGTAGTWLETGVDIDSKCPLLVRGNEIEFACTVTGTAGNSTTEITWVYMD